MNKGSYSPSIYRNAWQKKRGSRYRLRMEDILRKEAYRSRLSLHNKRKKESYKTNLVDGWFCGQ